MNKRIEDLIKICTEKVPYYPAGNNGHPEYSVVFNKNKFAELLIRECANLLPEECQSKNGCHAYWTILEHFEIKE